MDLNKDKLPVSDKERKRLRRALDEKINTDIGTIIEMSPEVWEILGSLYKEDQLLAKSIEILGDNLYKIKFSFPEYTLSKDKLDHVSINQMGAALVQGLFTAIGISIKQNGITAPMSYDTFLLNRNNALYRRDKRTMRKKLKFNEDAYLIYHVTPIIKKANMYSIKVEILRNKSTFLDGEVECVMQDQYLIDEETNENSDICADTPMGNDIKKNLSDTISMARVSCVESEKKKS